MDSIDRPALVALFRATGGSGWSQKANWDTDAEVSAWYGVKVNDEGRVVELKLDTNNLKGCIPSELGALGALRRLSLSCNQLKGAIADSLGLLSNLTYLDLGENELSGSIPKEVGSLTKLKRLSLKRNHLSDETRPCPVAKLLGLRSTLIFLDLWGNNLSGPIPPGLGSMSALDHLNLSWNKFTGPIPKEVGDLSALRVLDLSHNNLSGRIPEHLAALIKLERLSLCKNQLNGSIPAELGNLTALKALSLATNQLSDPIPDELGALIKLEALVLHNNQLTGPIPTRLGYLAQLVLLWLDYNQLSGPIPKELGNLTALRALRLGGNQLTGRIPEELGSLSKLKTLYLHENQLTEIPMAVADDLLTRGNVAEFFSDRNPWKKPPPEVIARGREAVVKYLQDLDTFGSALSNRLKVVLVGLGNAGKTSIAVRLERGSSGDLPRSEERTIGVEIRDIELGPNPAPRTKGSGSNLAVKLWDFAGQRAYYDTHQMFLTRGAMFILVVDMFAYSVENRREDALEQWLDILQSRVPGAVVLLVGTHRDKFKDNTRLLRERLQIFKADVEVILERMRQNCDRRRRPCRKEDELESAEPLEVVEEILVMDCKCSNEEDLKIEVKKLSSLIEKVAYEREYPTVEREVPAPYAHAVATLEAVRRGADLAGAGGDHNKVARQLGEGDAKRARAFIGFADALALFVQLWPEQKAIFSSLKRFAKNLTKRQHRPYDAAFLFWRAVELHEAEGSILLTCVDGREGWRDDDSMTNDIIIHVSPVRFADLVRRIVDVRLLEPERREDMERQLERFVLGKGKGVTVQQLSRQHNRFYAIGEVSRDFLEFLWERDLRLSSTSMYSPPLELDESDLNVMLSALVELRMMFPVCEENGLYVVGSCLPDHVAHDTDLTRMLELGVGSAMFSQRLEIVGAHNVPPGLIPRLLAWVGFKVGRFQACWKHGCCFAFGNHLTLVYACGNDAGCPSIMCCVKGDANREKAGDVLRRVGNEIGDLIRHKKYGFPGLDLREQRMEKYIVTREAELEALLDKLRERLEDHMNVRFDELERKSERIAGRVFTSTYENMTKLDGLRTSVEAVGTSAATIHSKLDAMGAIVGKCLLVSTAQAESCPRLVWIEEDDPNGASLSSPSRFGHFRRVAWDKLRRAKKGALVRTRLRIRFLCAHDLSLAECGHDGNGYLVEVKDWQRWLQQCLPLLQITLWLVRVGVSVIARADVLPVDSLLGALRELAGEEVAAQIEAIDLSREDISAGRLAQAVDDRVKVFGKAYTQLREFVHAQEDKIAAKPSMASDSTAETSLEERLGGCALPAHGAENRSFEKDMRLVHRVRDKVVEYAWVRGANVDAWQATPAAVTAQGTRQAVAFDP